LSYVTSHAAIAMWQHRTMCSCFNCRECRYTCSSRTIMSRL